MWIINDGRAWKVYITTKRRPEIDENLCDFETIKTTVIFCLITMLS